MGMDVYGIAPQTVGEQPKRPENWDSLTEYEQQMYYDSVDLWETNNPGVYFRANCWSWRPIHAICDLAINIANLPFDTEGWGHNSGAGLKTQEECNNLANAIGVYLELNNGNMHDMDDIIYLNLGSWNTTNGHFISQEAEDELNETHPIGTILYNGVVTKNGTIAFASHSCSLNHINNFISFLRKCGGFEIW